MTGRYRHDSNDFSEKTFCKGIIKAKYHAGDQCPFKAVKDGYCKRHHPIVLLFNAKAKVEKAERDFNLAKKELADLLLWAAAWDQPNKPQRTVRLVRNGKAVKKGETEASP